MINLNASVIGHTMTLTNASGGSAPTLPTGSSGVDAVSFSVTGSDWTGTTMYAVFWQDPGAVYRVAVSDNAAAIPAEVLSTSGNVYVALYGDNGDTRISTNACVFTAEQGALTAENAPAPTPSIFEQAVAAAVAAALATIVDNTLTVSGKAADAKATGDWLRMYLTPGDSYADEIAYIDALGRLAHGAFSRYVDDTLTISGKAADAQTVGDLIRELGGGFTPEAKQNLLTLLQHVVYVDDDEDYYGALAATLNPDATLISISAVFAQGQNVIYDTDSLDTLKQYLTVTAHYSDSTSATVSTYTLSGTLTAGTSTITVSYGGKSATFTATVTAMYTFYDYLKYTGPYTSDQSSALAQIIKTKEYADIQDLILDVDIMPLTRTDTIGHGVMGAQTAAGDANQVAFSSNLGYGRVSAFSRGTTVIIDNVPNILAYKRTHANLNPGKVSPTTIAADNLTQTSAWSTYNTVNAPIGYFGKLMKHTSRATLTPNVAIGTLKVYDLDNNLLNEYKPCVRNSDNLIGIYDTVEGVFYTCTTTNYAKIGNANCIYAVGSWS